MKFDELDSLMRSFETARDPCAAPETYIVARIDGRGFTRLTKETLQFARPFDDRFRDHMIATVAHLMDCGFGAVLGYTQSDEISLLFDSDEDAFGRNIRKWTSILAGEASAAFSLQVAHKAAFDCRVIELPTDKLVVDYFRWRNEDAHRNALNAWCYWTLRDSGSDQSAATSRVKSLSFSAKNELLFQHGINFNDLPSWQKRGTAVIWEDYEKPAINLKTGQAVVAHRRRLTTILDLPMRDDFSQFIRSLLDGTGTTFSKR